MFRKIVVITLLGLIPVTIKAGWWRTYGGEHFDRGRSICLAPDGGYVATGVTKSFGIYANDDLWLLKFDTLGDTMWTKVYAQDHRDWGHYITATSDGGYIIGGRSDFNGNDKCDMWLLKTDSQGDTLWTRHYGKEDHASVHWVEETADGGYILAGQFSPSYGLGSWLLKTDENGDTLWTHTYEKIITLTCVKPLDNGGYIIAAAGSDSVTRWPACRIQETDSLGNLLWFRQYFRGGGDFPGNMLIHPDGGYVIFCSSGGDDGGAWLVRTDDMGDTLWTRIYTILGSSRGQLTSDGGYVMIGTSEKKVMLLKTDAQGEVKWARTYGRGTYDTGYSVQQTSDGGYIILGDSQNSYCIDDICVVRTDSLGFALIEEELAESSNWAVAYPIGRDITLRYSNLPRGFHARVFDPSGRLVDELHSSQTQGTISWPVTPVGFSPGVYFIKSLTGNAQTIKVILTR